jgi:hypothetical protein
MCFAGKSSINTTFLHMTIIKTQAKAELKHYSGERSNLQLVVDFGLNSDGLFESSVFFILYILEISCCIWCLWPGDYFCVEYADWLCSICFLRDLLQL